MANTLEVRLSFKPLFGGLDRFTQGIQSRFQKVDALRLRLEKGAQQTNQILQTVATAASGAAIFSFFKKGIDAGVNFNAQLEQAELGIAAVLKQFDEVGKFKSFDDAITESGKAIDLLKAKAISSPASFSSLVQAFQGTVGPMTAANIALNDQVNLIVNMSQALAGLGIREEQILQETRALITGNINADAAAAKILGITSADITAAKQSGVLFEFLTGKISAFAEAGARGASTLTTLKSNLGDAFEQRTADAAKGLTEALKGFYTQATEFVLSPTFSALFTTLSDKIAAIVEAGAGMVDWMQSMSFTTDVFINLGSSASTWLVPLVAIGAALLVIRTSLGGLTTLIIPLRKLFALLAGVDLVDSVRNVRKLSKETGMLAAFSNSGWGQRIAASITLIAGAAAGFAIGSALISAIESAQLSRLEREDAIRELMTAQTRELREQITAATTLKQLKFLAGKAEKEALEVQAEIAKLEAEKAAAAEAQARADATAGQLGGGLNLSGLSFGSEQQTRLDALNTRLAYLQRNMERLRDPTEQLRVNLARVSTAKAREEISKLVDKLAELRATSSSQSLGAMAPESRFRELETQRVALARQLATIPSESTGDPKVDESNEAKRLDLEIRIFEVGQAILAAEKEVTAELDKQSEAVRKRELFNLESRAIAAESAGNSVLAKQLRDEIDRKELINDLGAEHIALIDARMAAEQALADHERSVAQNEIDFSREMGDKARRRAEIEADRYLTTEEKQAKIRPLLKEENRLIRERIDMLEEELLLGATDEKEGEIRRRIDELNARKAENAGEQEAIAPQTVGEGMEEGINNVLEQIGTKAAMVARGVQSVWQSVIGNIQDGLYNMITGTVKLGDGLKQIGISFGQSMLQAFTQMVAEYAVQRAAMFVIEKLFGAASAASAVGTSSAAAAVIALAWAPAAVAASIATLGGAATTGTAAYMTALASGTATSAAFSGGVAAAGAGAAGAFGGFRANGGNVEAGKGYVVGDGGVPEFFVPGSDGYVFPSVPNLSGAVANGLTQPRAGGGGGEGAGGGSFQNNGPIDMDELASRIQVINVSSLREANGIASHARARGDIVRIVEQEFGIRARR